MNQIIARLIGQKAAAKLPEQLRDIIGLSAEDMQNRGLTEKQSSAVISAVHLAEMLHDPPAREDARINGPSSAIAWCRNHFNTLIQHGHQEEFHVVTLDTKNNPIRSHLITRGTLRNSLVHPREVFRAAIIDSANCILVVHNHPSGDPTPSDQDISVTERLEAAAEIIGIPVIDHIVVAKNGCISIGNWRNT